MLRTTLALFALIIPLSALALTTREPAPAPNPPAIADFAWMAGSWVKTDGDTRSEEHWTLPAGDSMLCVSRTIRGNRTVMFEFCRLQLLDGTPTYFAQPKGREATPFKLKSSEANQATFENPAHDFPQRILYRRDGDDRLIARIEGTINGKPAAEDFIYSRAPAGVRIP
jgi:hypothetical protein